MYMYNNIVRKGNFIQQLNTDNDIFKFKKKLKLNL